MAAPVPHQLDDKVAGHTMFIDMGEMLYKGMDVREYHFYRLLDKCSDDFKSIFPTFHGVKKLVDKTTMTFVDVPLEEFDPIAEKYRPTSQHELEGYFIVIDNLAYGMKYACSMDVKLGTHWSYIGVSEERGKRYDNRWSKTTAAKVGLRYCGHIGYSHVMNSRLKKIEHVKISKVEESSSKLYRVFQNKNVGWEMELENLEDTMCMFFYYPELKFRHDLVSQAIEKVNFMINVLRDQKTFTFRSTSLLLVFDAEATTPLIKLALIDFSHEFEITPEIAETHEGLVPGDKDIVTSLENFNKMLIHRMETEKEHKKK